MDTDFQIVISALLWAVPLRAYGCWGVFGSGLLPIVAFVVVFQLRNGVFVALLGAQALQFAACADNALRAEGEFFLSFLIGMLGF